MVAYLFLAINLITTRKQRFQYSTLTYKQKIIYKFFLLEIFNKNKQTFVFIIFLIIKI